MFEVAADLSEVIIFPEDEVTEVLQNVKTVLSTVQGTVPLDRDFGINQKILDQPINTAQARMNAAIVEAINKFEPRAKVRKIFYDNTERETIDGILRPRVQVELVTEKMRGYVRIEDSDD